MSSWFLFRRIIIIIILFLSRMTTAKDYLNAYTLTGSKFWRRQRIEWQFDRARVKLISVRHALNHIIDMIKWKRRRRRRATRFHHRWKSGRRLIVMDSTLIKEIKRIHTHIDVNRFWLSTVDRIFIKKSSRNSPKRHIWFFTLHCLDSFERVWCIFNWSSQSRVANSWLYIYCVIYH